MASLPDPDTLYPVVLPNGEAHKGTVFLKNALQHPNIDVGRYTYAHASDPPQDWAAHLAPYLFPGAPERLKIGKFCQIADGVEFVTATANHPMDGLSTFPFGVFDIARFGAYRASLPLGSDVVVGNDCWIGRRATLLPRASLGNGVVVGAGAVVSGAVPDYAVVAGNPARTVRMRFSPDEIAALNALAWWDWTPAQIEAAMPLIEAGNVGALKDSHAAF